LHAQHLHHGCEKAGAISATGGVQMDRVDGRDFGEILVC